MEIRVIDESSADLKELAAKLGMRAKMEMKDVTGSVALILEQVRNEGDAAVSRFTGEFDKVSLDPAEFRVREDEIKAALAQTDSGLIKVMQDAYRNIAEFHEAQKENDVEIDRGNGSYVKLVSRAIGTAGIYVPGGTASLPSSVLMNIAPAKAAGVGRIVMCTPPRRDGTVDPVILAAASIAGADEIYRVGGAQAIAAMAFGTQTIPPVDKICGPGNIYVNTAKRLVYGTVDIDMFAGPSEILIMADDSAVPEYLAADLLSQAEHDKLASAVLITTSRRIAEETVDLTVKLAEKMPRKDILESSLRDYCAVVITEDMGRAVDFANELAPEHLELCVGDPEEVLKGIENAGAVFLGNYSPESLGDYYAGPNHVLPTSGTARFFSPLNTGDFVKKMSVISYSKESLMECKEDITRFARAEKLECHALAAEVRR